MKARKGYSSKEIGSGKWIVMFCLYITKEDTSGSMIFPSTAIQCSRETGTFFSKKAVRRSWERKTNSGFQILQHKGFGGSSAAEGILEAGTHS